MFGKVVARERIGGGEESENPAPPGADYRYRFRVLETYKGRVRRRIRLVGGTETSMCEAGLLRVGQRFGFVLHGRRGPWKIHITSFIRRSELRSVRRPKR